MKYSEFQILKEFLDEQRRLYAAGLLSEERKRILDSICIDGQHMDWDNEIRIKSAAERRRQIKKSDPMKIGSFGVNSFTDGTYGD